MEQLATDIAVYLTGWIMGILTLASLAFYEGRKKLVLVKVDNQGTVKNPYPPRERN